MVKPLSENLNIIELGRRGYAEALEIQLNAVEQLKAGEEKDTLILVEHDPVYTLGRGADKTNVLASKGELKKAGIDLVQSDRGGDVTYHGPGQVVAYPVINLRARGEGVLWYVESLEKTVLNVIKKLGIEGGTDSANRGVWVGNDKIAAIGVRVTRGITMHGFALNVRVNIEQYRGIIPCGIIGKGITSLHKFVPDITMKRAFSLVAETFVDVFGY